MSNESNESKAPPAHDLDDEIAEAEHAIEELRAGLDRARHSLETTRRALLSTTRTEDEDALKPRP
jgi:hypothetical protein